MPCFFFFPPPASIRMASARLRFDSSAQLALLRYKKKPFLFLTFRVKINESQHLLLLLHKIFFSFFKKKIKIKRSKLKTPFLFQRLSEAPLPEKNSITAHNQSILLFKTFKKHLKKHKALRCIKLKSHQFKWWSSRASWTLGQIVRSIFWKVRVSQTTEGRARTCRMRRVLLPMSHSVGNGKNSLPRLTFKCNTTEQGFWGPRPESLNKL